MRGRNSTDDYTSRRVWSLGDIKTYEDTAMVPRAWGMAGRITGSFSSTVFMLPGRIMIRGSPRVLTWPGEGKS
jgi:hypothetical protein